MHGFYRKIIYAQFAIYLAFLVLPYAWGYIYDEQTLNALSWIGLGGIIDIYGPVPYAMAALLLVSLVGLHQFKKWGRTLFLGVTVISGFLSPLFGLMVQGHFDAIFAYFLSIGSGVILALSYFSSINVEFK